MKFLRFFSPYEWFLLTTIVALNFLVFIVTGEWEVISTVATISGVLCVVLVAKGHLSNYVFGLIQVSLYTYLSWGVGYWGEVALNGLYYVPMQFVGFFMWKNRTREGGVVISSIRLGAQVTVPLLFTLYAWSTTGMEGEDIPRDDMTAGVTCSSNQAYLKARESSPRGYMI
jgi:nicotinamide mononucleotide transporter